MSKPTMSAEEVRDLLQKQMDFILDKLGLTVTPAPEPELSKTALTEPHECPKCASNNVCCESERHLGHRIYRLVCLNCGARTIDREILDAALNEWHVNEVRWFDPRNEASPKSVEYAILGEIPRDSGGGKPIAARIQNDSRSSLRWVERDGCRYVLQQSTGCDGGWVDVPLVPLDKP